MAAGRPAPSQRLELWLLRVEDVAVAGAIADLPDLDNLDQAEVELGVHPDHQHHGHGRFLRDTVLSDLHTQGRTRILADISEPPGRRCTLPWSGPRRRRGCRRPPSRRYAGRSGSTISTRAPLKSLHSDAVPHAAGYQLDGWTGPYPDDLAEGYAALAGRMSTDAPQGDLRHRARALGHRSGREPATTSSRHRAASRSAPWRVTSQAASSSATPTSSPRSTTSRPRSSGTPSCIRTTEVTGSVC